jgi:hypothetical protein
LPLFLNLYRSQLSITIRYQLSLRFIRYTAQKKHK